jgi:hypothetical protein
MVELLIATLLLFLIVIGVAPLFARSAVSNAMGSDMTQLSNHGKSEVEEFYQMPFNSVPMTITAGTDLVTREVWDDDLARFVPLPDGTPIPTSPPPRWVRITTVRQYSLPAFEAEALTHADALDAGAPEENIQLKEVEVEVISAPGGPIRGRRMVARTLKPF